MSIVQKAAKYATHMHYQQFRKAIPIPYVTHCFEVMKLVSTYTKDEEIWAAALLHDTIEDTPTEYSHIKDMFGERIADMVRDCTREGGDDVSKQAKWDFLASFSGKPLDSILIKIADRHVNVADFKRTGKKTYYSTYALQGLPVYEAYKYASPASFPEKIDTKAVDDSLQFLSRCIFENITIRGVNNDLYKIPIGEAMGLCL